MTGIRGDGEPGRAWWRSRPRSARSGWPAGQELRGQRERARRRGWQRQCRAARRERARRGARGRRGRQIRIMSAQPPLGAPRCRWSRSRRRRGRCRPERRRPRPGDAGDRGEHHLRDPHAVGDGDRLGAVVDQDDADLAAVVAVDGAGALSSVRPWRSARPERGRSCTSWPAGSRARGRSGPAPGRRARASGRRRGPRARGWRRGPCRRRRRWRRPGSGSAGSRPGRRRMPTATLTPAPRRCARRAPRRWRPSTCAARARRRRR